MDKAKRLAIVAALLETDAVGDQETLRRALARKGVKASQASVSRDLKALGALRVRSAKGWAYALPKAPPAAADAEDFRRRFAASVREVRRAAFLLLLFTPPGEAHLVGRLLDEAGPEGLLGDVAGDDTILAVARDEKTAKKLERSFKEWIA